MSVGAVGFGLNTGFRVLQYIEETRQLRASARDLETQAYEVLKLGRISARHIKEEGRRTQGEIRAVAAASGLQFAGSPLAVALDQAVQTERDQRAVMYEAEAQAAALTREAGRRRDAAGSFNRMVGLGTTLAAGYFLGPAAGAVMAGNGGFDQGLGEP